MSSFYVGRDLGERYNTKGTESNVQLCCGFRQRLGKLLSVLRAMYISAVTSVRETGKLLSVLGAMYSSAVASVRKDAGCTTGDSYCPVGLKLEWCSCSPLLFLFSVVCAQNESQQRRHGQRVQSHGPFHHGWGHRAQDSAKPPQPLVLLVLFGQRDRSLCHQTAQRRVGSSSEIDR